MIIELHTLTKVASKLGMSAFSLINKLEGNGKLELILQKIKAELIQVYDDIASAHFKSAQQALIASRGSTSPEFEMRSFISHMRDAHNIYDRLLKRKEVITNTILFFFKDKYEENYIERLGSRAKISQGNYTIAILIAIMYAGLKEKSNFHYWKNVALNDFKEYDNTLKDITWVEDFYTVGGTSEHTFHTGGTTSYTNTGVSISHGGYEDISDSGFTFLKEMSKTELNKLKEVISIFEKSI